MSTLITALTSRSPTQHWTRSISGEGGDLLIFAVRNGRGHTFLLTLAAVCLSGGAWASFWLLSEGELTVAGAVFLLLVPGGMMLFGVYSLNIALWLRHEYVLGRHALMARSYSLFGDKRTEIPRPAITGIRQAYTPPKSSSAAGAQGDWVVFVTYRNAKSGELEEFPLDGKHSEAEACWLGPWLSEWAGVPLHRGFGAGFDEVNPEGLPTR